ncbi:UDP-N-acetylglucosamine-peptide N-acetylglucosaminyltransferase, partial [Arthrospira platensis SPKY1]|nr:UDP-N-acetylglucosamine-peptide N-acetylglucosaminyltransferase [Arthrospira platensis SPKY1]
FLGYPNTMGAEFVQYLITDNWVVPESLARFYTEEIVYLPHQFICSFMDISNQPLNRADFGLPESGFVFACFNRHYKISPDLFQVWMQILQQVEGSVLWLSLAVEETLNHLRRAASTAGVDPQRLIFARKLPHNQYLARMQ